MAGLGLQNAVMAYQQGRAWRDNQDQMAEQKAKRDRINAANMAGSEVMKQAQTAHEAEQAAALDAYTKQKGTNEGFQATPFKMNEGLMLQALDARSQGLAKGGDWDDWMANEAKAAPLREQVRAKTFDTAMKQFDLDGDPIKLAQTVYPTIYDGKKIVKPIIDKTGGVGFKAASGLANAGEAMPMERISFELDDGTKTRPMTKDELVTKVKWASMNPGEVRQYELQQRLNAAKLAHEQAVAEAKGDQDRKTKKVEIEGKKGLAVLNHDREDARADADRASNEKQTAAKVGATRYSADQGLAAAKVRTTAEKKGNPIKTFSDLHDEVRKIAGESAMGALGGTKMANEDTMNIARFAQALIDEEDADPGDAINTALTEFKKRKQAKPEE